MKKSGNLIIGFIAGAIFMFSAQIYGAGILTGEKVDSQMTVKVNDKTIGSAAVINGTSYVPVRSIADELKMQVKVSGGDINLTTSGTPVADKDAIMGALITKRTITQNGINSTTDSINGLTTNVIPELEKGTSSLDKKRLEIAQKHLADFQNKLEDLNQQLEDINNQIQAAESE